VGSNLAKVQLPKLQIPPPFTRWQSLAMEEIAHKLGLMKNAVIASFCWVR